MMEDRDPRLDPRGVILAYVSSSESVGATADMSLGTALVARAYSSNRSLVRDPWGRRVVRRSSRLQHSRVPSPTRRAEVTRRLGAGEPLPPGAAESEGFGASASVSCSRIAAFSAAAAAICTGSLDLGATGSHTASSLSPSGASPSSSALSTASSMSATSSMLASRPITAGLSSAGVDSSAYDALVRDSATSSSKPSTTWLRSLDESMRA
mmetsp:Transcript_200/g.759  ORF Transcript_200/g.759 Transcript_200/m.759 type:complete len:210 (-) Transcript_200:1740-2369(-)